MVRLLILSLFWFPSIWSAVVFYHIPKSGGLAIGALLECSFSAEDSLRLAVSKKVHPFAKEYFYEDIGAFKKTVPEQAVLLEEISLEKDLFLRGHIPVSVGFKHFPNTTNITFLRDPIRRILSHENFWKVCAYHYPDDNINGSHLIPKGNPFETSDNLQVYYLSSYSRFDEKVSLRDHLESAKSNLENHFDFVGITEYMEDSVASLFHLLGFGFVPDIPRVNSYRFMKTEHSEKELEKIRERNWADIELYEFAKELFLKKYKNLPRVEKVKPFQPKEAIHYSFDQKLDGNGWGARERSANHLYYLRSSFIKDAWIGFPLKKNTYEISFIGGSPLQENLDTLKLQINGKEIKLKRDQNKDWPRFRGVIPKTCIVEGKKTEIHFIVPSLYKPSDYGQKLDEREIGIAIAEIEIKPVKRA